MKRHALYTAIVGDYDVLLQPTVVDDRFDYILFSDSITEPRVGVWQVRNIPFHCDNLVKKARWVKCHPSELLPEYSSSLWIDASIQIVSSDIYHIYNKLEQSAEIISTIKHPERHCAYEEMLAVVSRGYERERIVLRWGQHLRRERYPRNNGLTETGMIYRKHCQTIDDIDHLWWQCIKQYSQRDQLSFDYCLWKHSIEYKPLFPNNETVWNSNIVEYHPQHKNAKRKNVATKIKEGWVARYANRGEGRWEQSVDIYYTLMGLPFVHFMAFIAGQYLRLKDIIITRLPKQ